MAMDTNIFIQRAIKFKTCQLICYGLCVNPNQRMSFYNFSILGYGNLTYHEYV